MPTRVQPNNDNAQHSAGYSELDEHRSHDEHTYLLRSLLFGALIFTGVLYGLGVYFGLSFLQRAYAVKDFTSLARKAGTDIRKSFAQSNKALEYLAERYATTHPDESEWPLVMLPGFEMKMPYLRDISGFDTLSFAPLVRFEEVNSTERFLMDAWAADPLISASAGLLTGIYGVNESAGTVYKDTSRVDWDARYEIVAPLAQLLFDREVPVSMLGRDIHASSHYGPVVESTMRCTYAHNYSYARGSCGRVTALYDPGNLNSVTVQSTIMVPIMLGHNSSQMVGIVGGQFQWGKVIASIIPDYVSGIGIVLRVKGDAVTLRVDNGQVVLLSVGDTHGKHYDYFKHLEAGVLISGTDICTIEFYPHQKFIDLRTDDSPVYLSVGTALFILLCTLLFFLYDVPMRNSAIRTEIVLETKRRFVRFVRFGRP